MVKRMYALNSVFSFSLGAQSPGSRGGGTSFNGIPGTQPELYINIHTFDIQYFVKLFKMKDERIFLNMTNFGIFLFVQYTAKQKLI